MRFRCCRKVGSEDVGEQWIFECENRWWPSCIVIYIPNTPLLDGSYALCSNSVQCIYFSSRPSSRPSVLLQASSLLVPPNCGCHLCSFVNSSSDSARPPFLIPPHQTALSTCTSKAFLLPLIISQPTKALIFDTSVHRIQGRHYHTFIYHNKSTLASKIPTNIITLINHKAHSAQSRGWVGHPWNIFNAMKCEREHRSAGSASRTFTGVMEFVTGGWTRKNVINGAMWCAIDVLTCVILISVVGLHFLEVTCR